MTLRIADSSLRLEALCDRKTPADAAVPSPTLSDELERCGGYLEVGYELRQIFKDYHLNPVLRLEQFDDDRDVDDAGDARIVSVGVNAEPVESRLRMQLHFNGRQERYGAIRKNNNVIFTVQGSF